MSDLPLRARISAAKALLEASAVEEYDDLPPTQQAHFQEAIEFLKRVEEGLELAADEQTAEGEQFRGSADDD